MGCIQIVLLYLLLFHIARGRFSHKQHVTVNKTGENYVLTDGLCFLSAKQILRNMATGKEWQK
jgi:hypothetical protein